MIIAVKYGYYSGEHMEIIRNVKVNAQLNWFDLLVASSMDKSLDNLYERMFLISQFLDINKKEFYFEVSESQLKGREHLLSKEAMYYLYE